MYTDHTLKPIDDNAQYTSPGKDGTKYPPNWPKDEIPGLHKVILTDRPDNPGKVVTGFRIDEQFTQVWEERDLTDEEIYAQKMAERNAALSEKWSTAEDLVDDILERGIDTVRSERNAIKATKPLPSKPTKPKKGK
jgi:hypothetical protein